VAPSPAYSPQGSSYMSASPSSWEREPRVDCTSWTTFKGSEVLKCLLQPMFSLHKSVHLQLRVVPPAPPSRLISPLSFRDPGSLSSE
jgi:hypothetical protein